MSQELCSSMEKAPQRALLKSLGLTEAELKKPMIAVVSSVSEIDPAAANAHALAEAVKAGVYAGGCTPIAVPIVSIGNGLAANLKYSLPTRELVADSVETLLGAHAFDGAVFVTSGASAFAGMLMGAVRVNIPSIFISCGPTASGRVYGKKVGLNSVIDCIGAVNGGEKDIAELTALENGACPAGGGGNGLGAENALACMCEAMGISLMGNGTALSTGSERIRLAKRSGLAACELVRDAITPRMIITKRAIINALTLDMALGANGEAILHLTAIADECSIALGQDAVQNISDATPTLCDILPRGSFDMHDYALAGGVAATLHELAKAKLIDGSLHTVEGAALADFYEHAHVTDTKVIRKIDSPIMPYGGISIVKGNLAEDGAIVTRTADKSALVFMGKAKCYNCEEDAVAAIVSGKIKKGDALVVRYEGPIGGPGMRELAGVATALIGAGLDKNVAVVTDGRLPASLVGITVANVCPEAAADGKIALVKDGDAIKLDVCAGRISLEVPAKELQARQKKLRPKDSHVSGWMLRYQNLVTSAATGAVLKKRF